MSANSILRHSGALIVALLAVSTASSEHIRTLPSHVLWDFGSFYASAQAAARDLNPYAIYPLTFVLRLPDFTIENPNLNPPVFALLFQPLTMGEPAEMFRLWRWISIAFYILSVSLLVQRFRQLPSIGVIAWMAGLAGFWDTLLLGQIYTPLLLLIVVAYLRLECGHEMISGMLIGALVAIKPNFLVIPVVLFLSGHIRPAAAALGTFMSLWLLALILYGFDDYQNWVSLLVQDADRRAFPTNMSIWGMWSRAQLPAAGSVSALGFLVFLAAWAYLRRPDPRTSLVLALFGSLVSSPLAWVHYSMFLAPVILAYVRNPFVVFGALLFMIPVPTVISYMNSSFLERLTIGSAYNWALLFCLIGVMLSERNTGSFKFPRKVALS